MAKTDNSPVGPLAKTTSVVSAPKTPTEPAADHKGPDELLTKQELAARFKVSVRTIEKWSKDGFLPRIHIVSVVRFYWPEVVAHLLKNSGRPGPKVPPDGHQSKT